MFIKSSCMANLAPVPYWASYTHAKDVWPSQQHSCRWLYQAQSTTCNPPRVVSSDAVQWCSCRVTETSNLAQGPHLHSFHTCSRQLQACAQMSGLVG